MAVLMISVEIVWNDPTEFPEEVNRDHNDFTVDVLIYNSTTKEHSIGWFDFKEMKWHFLCREMQKGKWKWRYIIEEIDKFKKPK